MQACCIPEVLHGNFNCCDISWTIHPSSHRAMHSQILLHGATAVLAMNWTFPNNYLHEFFSFCLVFYHPLCNSFVWLFIFSFLFLNDQKYHFVCFLSTFHHILPSLRNAMSTKGRISSLFHEWLIWNLYSSSRGEEENQRSLLHLYLILDGSWMSPKQSEKTWNKENKEQR